MDSPKNNNSEFLNKLKASSNIPNAFMLYNYSNFYDYPNKINLFGLNEDLYDFEIRCPICFQRVGCARRPDNCIHIFCSSCIELWKKDSNKCPVCRKAFTTIKKVNYSEPWVKKYYS